LLAWFRREKRRLPWRGTRDPYRIWASEVMLQQTTVAAVRGRYETFLRRFPNVGSLARAREEQVLAAWSGLGYYARARNLRAAAREIVAVHGGRVPRDPAALRELPGFGEYMAAAVASLAFGKRIAAADANVTRVMSRLFAIEGLAGTRAHTEEVRRRAASLLPRKRPGDATAALMDLGQQICTARTPRCPVCPVARFCAARRRGLAEQFPLRRRKPKARRVHFAAAVAVQRGRALLFREEGSRLSGLWSFPSAEGSDPRAARERLARAVARLGLRLTNGAPEGAARHTIVNRRLEIRVYRAETRTGSAPRGRWLTRAAFRAAAIPTLARKIARAGGLG
jgi:A/G-specific adenine glycosylase